MKYKLKSVLAMALLLCFASATNAQLYTATGATGVTTSFNFVFNYTLNQVTVNVDNTVAGSNGAKGSLTSFGFNIPTNLEGTGSLIAATGVDFSKWHIFDPYDLNAGGGAYVQDVGAGTGPNENGGTVAYGVTYGHTATFTFQFADFNNHTGFVGDQGVTARWQGITPNGSSDEAFGHGGFYEGNSTVPVPEPATYGICGMILLAGMIFVRRVRFQANSLA